MKTARWLTLAPHNHHSGCHTFRRRHFHMNNHRTDPPPHRHNNGYLYAEKNRPHPICLPFQHHEFPARIQQFDADDDWDITDIDGIKNETPMVLIQRYNGFCQGIRNDRLGSITEEEEETADVEKTQRSVDHQGTLYSRHSLDSTTDYASDDEEEETEYDGNGSHFESQMARKPGISNLVHLQRKAHSILRSKHRFTQISNEEWPHNYPVHIRNVDNFLLHKPMTSARTPNERTDYGPKSESEECFQILSGESEACESEGFPSKRNLQVPKYFQPTPSKINNYNTIGSPSRTVQDLPGEVDLYKEWIGSTCKSFNQNPKTNDTPLQISENDIYVKSFPRNLAGNAPTAQTTDNDVTSGSDLTDDNFYKTFLPSSLAENESVTKINPIAILCANHGGEEKSPHQKEIETMHMKHDDKERGFEQMEAEFVYSVEDFPHPPDHFFDFDSSSVSSVSFVTGNYEEDKREFKAGCGQSMAADDHICQGNGHLTFVVTNQNNDESVDSSSDCFSEFARQSSRESDFISESVSTEFTFEANPSESIHSVPMNGYLENGDRVLKSGMFTELNNDEEKARIQDTEDAEDIHSKQISDTILQSYLNLKNTTSRYVSSRTKDKECTIFPQCGSNSEAHLHLNKQSVFDIISTKDFNQGSKKRKSGIKTNGRCLHNESNLKLEYDESGSVLYDKEKIASTFCIDHSREGDQSRKARLSAVQNMLQRAHAIDKVCYMATDSPRRTKEGQWKPRPCPESLRLSET